MNIKETIRKLIEEALDNCTQSGLFSEKQVPPFVIETPKMKDHGDYATNVAMLLAPLEKKPPRKIAQDIIEHIPKKDDVLEKFEIAGPWFINFFISRSCWLKAFQDISLQGSDYGKSRLGQGKKINLEYVSANPTGPLHIGHGPR